METLVGVGEEPDLLNRLEGQRQGCHGVHVVGQGDAASGFVDEPCDLGVAFGAVSELAVVHVEADQRREVSVVEAGFGDAEMGRVGESVLHHRLGKEIGEVEGHVVAAGRTRSRAA